MSIAPFISIQKHSSGGSALKPLTVFDILASRDVTAYTIGPSY